MDNDMITSSNVNIFHVTGPLCGVFTGHRWIPIQRLVTRSLVFSLFCALNKRLSKQMWGWWFQTPTRSLWRHINDKLTGTKPQQNTTKDAKCAYFVGCIVQCLMSIVRYPFFFFFFFNIGVMSHTKGLRPNIVWAYNQQGIQRTTTPPAPRSVNGQPIHGPAGLLLWQFHIDPLLGWCISRALWPKSKPIVCPTVYPTHISFIPSQSTFLLLKYG